MGLRFLTTFWLIGVMLMGRNDLSAREPVKLRVTASGDAWIHQDRRSGTGESQPLRVYAQPGDVIEFYRSDGEHGVMFYLSKPGLSDRTELGRPVNVDQGFVVISDVSLRRVRGFRRQNLATPTTDKELLLIAIRLREDFKEPVFFACPRRATGEPPTMFGVILPMSFKPQRQQRDVPRAAELTSATEPGTTRLAGVDPTPGRVLEFSSKGVVSRSTVDLEATPIDVTERWFRNDEARALSPQNSDVKWYFSEAFALDPGSAKDVVALIRSAERTQWHVFRNRSDRESRNSDQRIGFLRPLVLPESDVDEERAARAVCGAADLNHDSIRDLILFQGDDASNLPVYYAKAELYADPVTRTVGRRLREYEKNDQPLELLEQNQHVSLIFGRDLNSDGWEDLVFQTRTADGPPTLVVAINSPEKVFSRDNIFKREISVEADSLTAAVDENDTLILHVLKDGQDVERLALNQDGSFQGQ
jgi:hypothetical protein